MMRHKSVSSFRESLNAISHLKTNQSLKKIQSNQANKISQVESVKKSSLHKPQRRDKQIKIDNKGIINKDKSIVQAKAPLKVQLGVRTNTNSQAIHIKSDLKNLITRMTRNKQKKVEVPGLAQKYTHKRIKSTKNSNQKEPKQTKRSKEPKQMKNTNIAKLSKPSILQNKRCSYQQSLQTVPQRIVISRNKTHNSQQQNPKQKKQQIKSTKLPTHSNPRYSLDSYHIGVKKAQIQESLKIKPFGKVTSVSCKPPVEDKNFIQVFKQYKKSFDVDNIKIDKSQKQDSLSISQSRKVSFLNSDRYATASILFNNEKTKFAPQIKAQDNENAKIYKSKQTNVPPQVQQYHGWHSNSQNSQVQTIIRQAKSQISLYKQCGHNCRVDTTNEEEQSAVLFGKNNFKFKKTIEIANPKKPAIFLHILPEGKKQTFNHNDQIKQQQYQYEISKDKKAQLKLKPQEQPDGQQICKNVNTLSKNPITKKLQQRQFFTEKESIQQSTLIPNTRQKDYQYGISTGGQKLYKQEEHFKNSKYYVQPIPVSQSRKNIKSKQSQPQIEDQQLDVSLIGCEITLIENNIIEDQGELAELQL